MTETTAAPDTLKGIMARYREIAPEPDPESPDVAAQLARKLLVNAMRQNARNTAEIIAGSLSAEGFDALCAGFAAVHLLLSQHAGTDQDAVEIAGILLDGGGIEEVLYDHAVALGVDPEEVWLLAEAEVKIKAAAEVDGQASLFDPAGDDRETAGA